MTQEKVSPFTPGIPVSAEMFTGRGPQIASVSNHLTQASSGRMANVFLTGERGIGKSSFASFILQKARAVDDMVGAHVHLGGADTLEELTRRIIQDLMNEISGHAWYDPISEFIGDHVRKVGVFGVTLEFRPPSENLAGIVSDFPNVLGEFLSRIKEHKAGAVIILDDINGFAEMPLFANWYKSVADHVGTHFGAYPALVMLSGLPQNREQLAAHQPSLLRVFTPLELDRLTDEEVERFFENAFATADMRVKPDAMRLMALYSSGLPTMMQEIGDAVFWSVSGDEVKRDDASRGLSMAAIRVGQKYLDPSVYNALRSQHYQTIIMKLSESPMGQRFTRQQAMERLTPEERKTFDNFLRRLRELGVVERAPEDGRGVYRYTNRIFPLYMYLKAQGIA